MSRSTLRVLVTGGAGFIGANLCRRLAASGDIGHIRVIDDLSSGNLANLEGLDVAFVEGSILDAHLLNNVSQDCDAIVHLAAVGSVPRSIKAPLVSHEANATGTLRVLEAARHQGTHVVLASSSSVYGANPKLPKSEDLVCLPMSPYAVSKLAAEQYALAYGLCYKLPVLPLRFFNVYGPLQPAGHAYAAVIPTFIQAALAGTPVPVNGDGCQTRDFTFVDTVTEVLLEAIIRRVTGGPVNLAFGTRTSLLAVINVLEEVMGKHLPRHHRSPRSGDVIHSQAANGRLKGLFPNVAPVPLEVGIRRTLDWFQEPGKLA